MNLFKKGNFLQLAVWVSTNHVIQEPELSHLFEVGIKSLLLDGKLLSSFNIFTIEKRNMSQLTLIEAGRNSFTPFEQRQKHRL